MVRRSISKAVLFLAVLLLMLTCAAPVAAEKNLVADLADIFSPAEEAELQHEALTLGNKYQMDIVIVTTNDAQGKSAMAFADDYFDNNGYGVGENLNGILLLLDYDNREVWISTSGSGIEYLTDAKIEDILDDIFAGNKMASGDNFGAATAFLSSTEKTLQGNTFSFIDGIVGLLASGATGLGFFATTKNSYKGKPKPNVFEYRGNSIVSMGIVTDNLVNSFTTSRIVAVPPSNNRPFGGGGSSTHTSSGGHTHGGGGRGF